MSKNQIIVISDVIKAVDDVVVVGVNAKFDDLSIDAIKEKIGSKIDVAGKAYQVKGVEITQSLIGHKNIFIKLTDAMNDIDRLKGQVVTV